MLQTALDELSERLGFEWQVTDRSVRIGYPWSPSKLLLLQSPTPDSWHGAFYIRTFSADWPGERTDLHDAFSTLGQAFLWRSGVASTRVVTVPHPATFIPGEIYARYVVPVQPYGSVLSVPQILELVTASYNIDLTLHLLLVHDNEQGRVDEERCAGLGDRVTLEWANTISRLLYDKDVGPEDLYYKRTSPTWMYYRSPRNGASAFRSERMAQSVAALLQPSAEEKSHQGVTGWLTQHGDLYGYVSQRLAARAGRAIRSLEGAGSDVRMVPLEDRVLVVGRANLLVLPQSGGRRSYEADLNRVRVRHFREAEDLFGPARFRWIEPLDPDRFEALTYDLLCCEPGVVRDSVRRTGPTTERDGGRDIALVWERPLGAFAPPIEQGPLVVRRRFSVQCKALMKNVGLSDVRDIRDSLDHYEADGFLLVASRQITSSLFDRLDQMRRRGDYDVEWWTRAEIDDRLRRNPEVAARFTDLVVLERKL